MQGNLFEQNITAKRQADRQEIFDLSGKSCSKQYIVNYLKDKNYFEESDMDIKSYLLQFVSQGELDAFINKSYIPNQAGNVHYFYNGIPEKETFRLFVDVRKQRKEKEHGFVGYEKREPGCIQAMYDAFQLIVDTINEPLGTSYIKNIHKRGAAKCPDIYVMQGYGELVGSSINPGEFKDSHSARVGMRNSSLSPLGIMEMFDNYQSIYLRPYTKAKCKPKTQMILEPIPKRKEEYEKEINNFIEEYQKEVSDPFPLNKLVAMVRLFQRLDRQHAFRDGNTRTYETLLLNRELVKHGFTPALLEDPDRFTGHTLNESVYELLRGMQNFHQLKECGHIEGCESTDEILKDNKQPIAFKTAV